MSDYTELQAELEAKKAAGWQCTDGLSIDTVMALIAENDSARKHWQNESNNVQVLVAEVARLKAENEALRKDAERYRWLRDSDLAGKILRDMGAKYRADADQRIDAAMGKGEQS